MPHRFSVVIEWENAKLSGLDRAREMLVRLGEQIKELDPAQWQLPELVILYDEQAIEPGLIADILNSAMGSAPPLRAEIDSRHGQALLRAEEFRRDSNRSRFPGVCR